MQQWARSTAQSNLRPVLRQLQNQISPELSLIKKFNMSSLSNYNLEEIKLGSEDWGVGGFIFPFTNDKIEQDQRALNVGVQLSRLSLRLL